MKDVLFYQSTNVIYTPVDFNNPLHRTLVEMIIAGKTPSPEANKIMKKAGFQSQVDGMRNTIIWSSDLFLKVKDHGILSHSSKDVIDEILEYLRTF
jgi:hypothetical protein